MGNSPGVHDAQVGPPRRDNKRPPGGGLSLRCRFRTRLVCGSGSAKRDRRLVAAAIGPAFVGPSHTALPAIRRRWTIAARTAVRISVDDDGLGGGGGNAGKSRNECARTAIFGTSRFSHCRNGFSDVRRCARNRARCRRRYLLDRVCMRHRSNPGKPSRKGATGKAA
jgi:hypothetical protein